MIFVLDKQLLKCHFRNECRHLQINTFSYSEQHLADDKDKEDGDMLGPLRPLPPSKSVPTMPLANEPDKVFYCSKENAGTSAAKTKTVSKSTLSLLMPPRTGEHVACEIFILVLSCKIFCVSD